MILLSDHSKKNLQEQLEALPKDAVAAMTPREYAGPVTIKRPLTLDGQGATIWARQGPVVTLKAEGIVLRNLRIEMTGDLFERKPEESCALFCKSSKGLKLENVEVRGTVMGLPKEEGIWRLPETLPLGQIAANVAHEFRIQIMVPVSCRLAADKPDVIITPGNLPAGDHEIKLRLAPQPRDTWLNIALLIATGMVMRRIVLTAHLVAGHEGHFIPVHGRGQLVWEPQRGAVDLGAKPKTAASEVLIIDAIPPAQPAAPVASAPYEATPPVKPIPPYPEPAAPQAPAPRAAIGTATPFQASRMKYNVEPSKADLFKQQPAAQESDELKSGEGGAEKVKLSDLFTAQPASAPASAAEENAVAEEDFSRRPRSRPIGSLFDQSAADKKAEEAVAEAKPKEPAPGLKPQEEKASSSKRVQSKGISELFKENDKSGQSQKGKA